MSAAQKRDLNEIGANAYAAIVEMVEALDAAADDDDAQEKAREAIEQDPLSVEVRSDWHSPGGTPDEKPTEFRVLLATGGPAVRIVGTLDRWCQPETATLQVQDWFTPWTDYSEADQSVLLQYLSVLYFGE